jgi:hypothetical protein
MLGCAPVPRGSSATIYELTAPELGWWIVYYRRVSLVQEVRRCPYVEGKSIWRASGTDAACG